MIGDGEHISNTLKTGSLDDIGTRMKFLLELYDLWVAGADICTRYDSKHPNYSEKIIELQHALKLLRYHLEKDYSDKAYRKEIDEIRSPKYE
jgi:hypothetical protein